ncbi:hypothetical protein GmHk_10G029320 [Glycine max]|nr:hypothetical protein GmHk_10G029320 [Glycine max]
MGLQINLGLQHQLIVLIVSLPLGLHPSPLGPSSFSTRGLCPSPLGPSSFSTWAFRLYLTCFMILITTYCGGHHEEAIDTLSGKPFRPGLDSSQEMR